jgi:hypothetical protein
VPRRHGHADGALERDLLGDVALQGAQRRGVAFGLGDDAFPKLDGVVRFTIEDPELAGGPAAVGQEDYAGQRVAGQRAVDGLQGTRFVPINTGWKGRGEQGGPRA